jgi:hypothetical protein
MKLISKGPRVKLLAEAREYYEGEIELASYMKEINI